MITHDQFTQKYQGRYLEFNNDQYKNQWLTIE